MRPLSDDALLRVWERGQGLYPVRQALELLAAACPNTSYETLARLTVDQRDSLLLTLRELTFGRPVEAETACPYCGELLELPFATSDIRVPAPADEPDHVLTVGDHEVRFRLPTSADLDSVAGAAVAAGKHRLLLRCLIAVRRDRQALPADEVPAPVLSAVAECMAELAGQSEVRLALCCPRCRHAWQAPFDILSFFWAEIHAWAARTFREIHALAAAYGWREADILALSPRRRRLYLEMTGNA